MSSNTDSDHLETAQKNKRIAKNMQALYIRLIFNMCISLYTSRVILKTLGVEDFGIYGVIGGIVTSFAFLNNAMASATQRYLTYAIGQRDTKQLERVFATSINIHIAIAIIVLILGETIGLWFVNTQLTIPEDRLDAANIIYQFAIFTCIIAILSIPYNAAIIAREKMTAFAYISVLETLLKLLAAIALYWVGYDKLISYGIFILIAQIIIRVIYQTYCYYKIPESKFKFTWDKELMTEMSSFAGWTLNGNLAFIGYTQGLNILLNIFFGPAINAARAIAVQVQTAILSFSKNIQQAINPQITKSYATSDFAYMHKLIFSSSKYSFYLLYIIALPLFLKIDLVLNWWLDIVPNDTSQFIRLMILISLVDTLSNSMIISVHATGRIKKFQLIEGFVLLLIVPISYLTLRLGGSPCSIFIVHLIFASITQVIRVKITCPMIQLEVKKYLSYVVYPICKVLLASSFLPILIYYFFPSNNLLGLIGLCLISIITTTFSIFYLGIESNEKKVILSIISNKLSTIRNKK